MSLVLVIGKGFGDTLAASLPRTYTAGRTYGSSSLVYEARNGRYEVMAVYEPVTRLVRPAVQPFEIRMESRALHALYFEFLVHSLHR